jgi:alkanesulfonate monooxygenase SsuD/methylene tetrahydromethanopterin reductase-like flavin-dependent oxidoreductase (luciferase family)
MNLSEGGMKHPPLVILAAAVTLAANFAVAHGDPCSRCEEVAPMTDREQIRAARDKFEREMKRDTRRPWDGTDLYRKDPPVPPKEPVKDAQ